MSKDKVTWELRTLSQPLIFLTDKMNGALVESVSEKKSKLISAYNYWYHNKYPFQKAYSVTQKADANMGINTECNEACGNAHINRRAVRFLPHICIWVHAPDADRNHLHPGLSQRLPHWGFFPRLQWLLDEALP